MKVEEIKSNRNNFIPDCFELNINEKFLCLKLNSANTTNKLPTEIKLGNLQQKNTQKHPLHHSTDNDR